MINKIISIVFVVTVSLLTTTISSSAQEYYEEQEMVFSEDEIDVIQTSFSGDYAIMSLYEGDWGGSYSKKATIYKRINNSWIQQVELIPSDGTYEGGEVLLLGDYAFIIATTEENLGVVYVFKRDGENWIEHSKLSATAGGSNEDFGQSLTGFGDYVAVRTDGSVDVGYFISTIYVFKREGDSWGFHQKILSESDYCPSFYSLKMDGNHLITIHGRVGCGEGRRAYVYENIGGNFTFQDSIQMPSTYSKVSISGDFIALSYPMYEGGLVDKDGTILIYKKNNGVWEYSQELKASDTFEGNQFGYSVHVNGNYLIASAVTEDSDDDWPYDNYWHELYVFKFDGSSWIEQGKLISTFSHDYNQEVTNNVTIHNDEIFVITKNRPPIFPRTGVVHFYSYTRKNSLGDLLSLSPTDDQTINSAGTLYADYGTPLLIMSDVGIESNWWGVYSGSLPGGPYTLIHNGRGEIYTPYLSSGDKYT